MCEANYARLLRLFPDYENSNSREFVVGSARVRLEVVERCRYTTIFHLHQQHAEAAGWGACVSRCGPTTMPACWKSVCSSHIGRLRPATTIPMTRCSSRTRKSQQNRFLADWLEHCLQNGRSSLDMPAPGGLSSPGHIACVNPALNSYTSLDPGMCRLVQLTDTHLCRVRGGTLLGMDTDHSLQAVIDLVQQERAGWTCCWRPAICLTGERAKPMSACRTISTQLPGQTSGCLVITMIAMRWKRWQCWRCQRLSREIRCGNWQILMLDSQVPGEVGGELGATEMAFLASALEAPSEQGLYTLVCLHHQPVAIGSQWLDEQMVADAETSSAVLDRYPGAKACCGVMYTSRSIDNIRSAATGFALDLRAVCTPECRLQGR